MGQGATLRTRPHLNGVQKSGKKAIRDQYLRVVNSADFDTSKRSRDFLRHIVEESLAGRGHEITQYSLATHIFGRGNDFDPTVDPIVRMQAGRVRRSLEHYYLTSGNDDPVLITLPKGTYAPSFALRAKQPVSESTPDNDEQAWPSLLVSPMRNLTGDASYDFIGRGLASDLAAELSRYTAIHVFLAPAADPTPPCTARFELTGTIASREIGLRLILQLIDQHTGQLTWAQTFDCPANATRGNALDQIVQTTAAMVAEEHGLVSAQLIDEYCRPMRSGGSAYEAILRHHHFEMTQSRESFEDALTSLREAVKTHPNCGPCWSYLARLCAAHWSSGMPGESLPIIKTVEAAQRGVALNPLDPSSHLVLGYVRLVNDQIDQTRAAAEMALKLNQNSIFWLDTIGYLLTLSGDWERGPKLIHRAAHANPFHRKVCHAGLWLDAIRRNDPPAALAAGRAYGPPTSFWHPLMCAVALVEDGRLEEAAQDAQRILALKPDFSTRGHWLITRYAKYPDLVYRIEQALDAVGVTVMDKPPRREQAHCSLSSASL